MSKSPDGYAGQADGRGKRELDERSATTRQPLSFRSSRTPDQRALSSLLAERLPTVPDPIFKRQGPKKR